jgi:hypothetical protein
MKKTATKSQALRKRTARATGKSLKDLQVKKQVKGGVAKPAPWFAK